MSSELKHRRGTAAAHASFIGAQGEITVKTDTNEIVVHDGVTPGGKTGGGYMPAGTGAVATTVQEVLRRTVSVFDFMTVAQIADVKAGTALLDVTDAIEKALASSNAVVLPSGTYRVTPSELAAYNDASSVTRKTAFQISGKANVLIEGVGNVNIVVEGTDAERVAFFFKNCTNVTVQGLGFNLANSSISDPGGITYLVTENFFPLAFEGCDGVAIDGNKFVACRTAVFADALNGGQNKNFNVTNNTFKDVVNYSLITRNASGVLFQGNVCDGTGRSWNTSSEDCAFSNNTTGGQAIGNRFVNTRGGVSRITASKNAGPTVVSGNTKIGKGIFFEAYEASNGVVSGNTSINAVDTAEHFLFTADSNTGGENWTITGNLFKGGGFCISDYFPGTHTKAGLTVSGNQFIDCYGPQASSPRSNVVVIGNTFKLLNAGQVIYFSGDDTIFASNRVINGYLKVFYDNSSNRWSITDNHWTGNFVSAIPIIFDFSGTTQHTVRGNLNTGGYTSWFNLSPAVRWGVKFTDVGFSGNPMFGAGSALSSSVNDRATNDFPSAGTPNSWVCVSAGTPGAWVVEGQVGHRTGTTAPSGDAGFVGEEYLDTTAARWYKAKNTGTGASDWVALN